MLKYADYDVVFQELPNEVTLAINISNCPNRCVGCHSAYLMDDVGNPLTEQALEELLHKYGKTITCVCFMGGDREPHAVAQLAHWVKTQAAFTLKVGWYSGKQALPEAFDSEWFDYVKLGPYVPELGGLNHTTTNQRLYKITETGTLEDITACFWE